MDYKEKYEQALEVAKETYNKQPMYREWLGKMFPELKESEDERIRKELIEYFNEQCDMSDWNGVYGYQVVSWLEKQETSYTKRDVDKCNSAWSEEEERYICQLESMVKEKWALAEKAQDEEVIKNMSNLAFFLKTLNPNKKPTDKEMKTLLRTEYEKGRADAIAEMQKEWSEEDINMIDWLIRCCEEEHKELCNDKYGHQDIVSDLKRDCRKKWDWLESLKNRVAPQNKWKPSDEQIDALTETVHNLWGSPETTLSGLLADLKKLKED